MGYRSEVGLVMTKKLSKKLRGELLLDANASLISKLLDDAYLYETDEEDFYHWDEIKWYSTYPEIKFINKFLSDQEDDEDFLFIRIGEDTDDVEENGLRYDNDFDLGIVRYLSFSPSNSTKSKEPHYYEEV